MGAIQFGGFSTKNRRKNFSEIPKNERCRKIHDATLVIPAIKLVVRKKFDLSEE